MAQVKFGAGIIQISGSIAGVTHARNRFANYIRPRTKPTNPNSAGQQFARNAMKQLTEYWHSTCTAPERTAWNTYAAAVAWKNRLGETTYLTGFNQFVRSNSLLIWGGLPIAHAGPTVLALPESDPTFAIAASAGTGVITFTFDTTLPWHSESAGQIQIFMGEPQLATRNFFNGPWKHLGYLVNTDASGKTLSGPYTLVLGQKIWCYGRILRADARVSNPFVASCVVAA